MLTASDTQLVERDTALPGLATLIDPERMLEALRASASVPDPDTLHLESLRYRPATLCVATYTLESRGQKSTGYAKALPRDATHEPRGPASLIEPLVLFCRFPEDLKLRALSQLGNVERRRAMLARVLPERHDLHPLAPITVSYKPERRYVARLGPEREEHVALKFFRRRNFDRSHHHAGIVNAGRALALPRWIGSSERDRIAAMPWIEGPMLRDLTRRSEPDLSAVSSTALGLAELHTQTAALETSDIEQDVAQLHTAAELLGFLLPEQAERTAELASRLSSRIRAMPRGDALIHGDFYAKQIVLNRGRVYLLDLDTLSRGDPLVDVGLFLAHLERDVVLHAMDAEAARAVGEVFCERYQREAQHSLDGAAVHTAASLLRLASYPFRIRDPQWPDAIVRLLGRAETLLAG